MAEKIDFEDVTISKFQGLVTLTRPWIWSYCIPSCFTHWHLTINAKFHLDYWDNCCPYYRNAEAGTSQNPKSDHFLCHGLHYWRILGKIQARPLRHPVHKLTNKWTKTKATSISTNNNIKCIAFYLEQKMLWNEVRPIYSSDKQPNGQWLIDVCILYMYNYQIK